MKQRFFLSVLLMIQCFLSVWSQNMSMKDSITVSYEFPKDKFLYMFMEYQKVYALDVIVKSTKRDLFYGIDMVRYTDGQVKREHLTENYLLKLDTLNHFYCFAQASSNDTAHIAIMHPIYSEWNIPINTQNCILMETLPLHAYATADTIPLIAYTTGHEVTIEWNGQPTKAIDFCGVRYSKKHPSEWHKAFNLKDYLYFELILSPRKKDTEQ